MKQRSCHERDVTDRCRCADPVSGAANEQPDGIDRLQNVTEFVCPVCLDSPLVVGYLQQSQVGCCQKCQGFLIDSLSFGIIIGTLRMAYRGKDDQPIPLNQDELNQTINCPTCFAAMYTHPYHGPGNVIINSCSACQINWLDAGELTQIVRAPGRR